MMHIIVIILFCHVFFLFDLNEYNMTCLAPNDGVVVVISVCAGMRVRLCASVCECHGTRGGALDGVGEGACIHLHFRVLALFHSFHFFPVFHFCLCCATAHRHTTDMPFALQQTIRS